MMKYDFFIAESPFGKQRPKFGRGHAYTPKETREYEQYVKSLYHGPLFEGAVIVKILAGFNPQKGKEVYPTKKPDADNIAKTILDALNGVAYDDDKNVVDLVVSKRWTDEPFVRVYIEEKCKE